MELSRPVVQHGGHLTLTVDFQGQILKMLHLMNGRANWHGMVRMWVERMLHPLCDFYCSSHPWTWPWIFKVKFWKVYFRNGMADWHGIKRMWGARMLDPCCDFQCPPHRWPWPWIFFKVKFWKCCISGMGWPIDMAIPRNSHHCIWVASQCTPLVSHLIDLPTSCLNNYVQNDLK